MASARLCVDPSALPTATILHYQKQCRIHPDRRIGKLIVVIAPIVAVMGFRNLLWLKA
jgi:hypothetical protein